MTPRSKTVTVAVVVGKELLQDMMLFVSCSLPDPFEQSFVGVLGELGRSGVTVATGRTPRRTNASMRCLFSIVATLH